MSKNPSNRVSSMLAICGIITPISYTIVVIALGFLWSGYNHVTQFISELGGVGAPNAIIMNTAGFALTGILITFFAFGLYRGINVGSRSKTGLALVAVYGLGIMATGFFPWDKVNLASFTSTMHLLVGWTSWIAMILAPLFIARRLKNDSQWKSYRVYSLATGLVTAVLIFIYAFVGIEGYMGVLQRIIIGAPLLWIEVMAIKLFRLSTSSSP
jgi:hypothetical membrane protein